MHCQLYLSGRLVGNPETGLTKSSKPWVKLLLETELTRELRRGEFQTETVLLPISCFGRAASEVSALKSGESLTIGAHLHGTEFRTPDGSVKRGIQLVADITFIPARREPSLPLDPEITLT